MQRITDDNIRVYIAGPFTTGVTIENVKRAVSAANTLRGKGFYPYVPHLSYFWHLQHPHPYEDWMDLDLEWLLACDAVLRLPGKSPGADREIEVADAAHIPVFYSTEALVEHYESVTDTWLPS